MALSFPHKTTEEIQEEYNVVGLLAYCVPVYAFMVYDDDGIPSLMFAEDQSNFFPRMEETNWVPRPLYHLGMMAAGAIFGLAAAFKANLFPFIALRSVT